MSTDLDVFDATVQKTNEWLNQIQDSLELPSKDAAYAALRATLHALRDRIAQRGGSVRLAVATPSKYHH